jgi:hypothetical protein
MHFSSSHICLRVGGAGGIDACKIEDAVYRYLSCLERRGVVCGLSVVDDALPPGAKGTRIRVSIVYETDTASQQLCDEATFRTLREVSTHHPAKVTPSKQPTVTTFAISESGAHYLVTVTLSKSPAFP